MIDPLDTPHTPHDATPSANAQHISNTYVELHVASAFSFLRGASSPEALVARVASLGMRAIALTNHMTLAGVVRFQTACAAYAIQSIIGVELAVAEPVFGLTLRPSGLSHLVALAENTTGYARLCHLLSDANLAHPEAPVIAWRDLAAEPDGLILLTGGREGALLRLLLAGRRQAAVEAARRYYDAFGPEQVYVEAQHHRLPNTATLLHQLIEVAHEAGLRCVATNGVHHATRADCALYDLMTCTRLGLTVDQPHAERPRNDEAHLKSGRELASLFARVPHGRAALRASGEIAARCHLSLLKGACTAPQVSLPTGTTPTTHLRTLCESGLKTRYARLPAALLPGSPQWTQLDHELAVISHLQLEEFFLCVHDIMRAARGMGIRVSGRGSAANSLAAYCLGITGVDPIQHKLLFERFLNPDRGGMPDIDVDVQSDRRDELIRYVERVYTEAHAAMVANVITYRARSALRDAAKALGYPLELVNRMTKRLSHHADAEELLSHEGELRQVIATFSPLPDPSIRTRCLDRLPRLLEIVPKLLGLPRHLSLHNGGMVLTREPLAHLVPVRISANGVRALEIDKDDVERLGLIKFDLLGLRTLGAVEEALTLIEQTTGERPDIDHLPTTPPDPRTMALIRSGQTLAVFQIESPGQWHLLAQTQPTTFNDLIVQTALFRPGPIQGGFVHPYIERRLDKQAQQSQDSKQSAQGAQAARYIRQQRQQRDAVQTPWKGAPSDDFWTAHPVLGPILAESEGILLFQEQILEIAHRFAGLSYAEADGFRRAMSHQRSRREMEAMRARFVSGALTHGETQEAADRVFEAVSAFVGYGFCKSHAAEFARTIYQTAWLKAYYPAHYLAAFLSAQPAGYFPPHVVLEEAKRLNIPVLPVHVNASEDRFSVEPAGSVGSGNAPGGRRWGIRVGLRQVRQVGADLARAILWERRTLDDSGHLHERPFTSLWDLLTRLRPAGLTRDAAEALVWSGACDGLAPRMERRQRLWQLRELWPLVDPRAKGSSKGAKRRRSTSVSVRDTNDATTAQPQQMTLTWEMSLETLTDVPALPTLTAFERDALDYQLLGMSTRPHPMRHERPLLDRRGVLRIADLAQVAEGRIVRVAGWPISAQRPPTAHGVGFVVLEDETGRLPLALPPALAADLRTTLRDARYLVAVGRLERVRWYRSLWAFQLTGVPENAASRPA